METSSVSDDYKLLDPEFVDLEKTTIRFKIVRDGITTVAELKVPANRERGVNPYWDRIMDEHDVDELRRRRNELENRRRKQAEFEQKKREGKMENDRLVDLFNKKMKLFNLPVIANADDDTKAAIRRSPNTEFLNFVYYESLRKHMQDNNWTIAQLLDYLEEQENT